MSTDTKGIQGGLFGGRVLTLCNRFPRSMSKSKLNKYQKIEYRGKMYSYAELYRHPHKRPSISYQALYLRINAGWSVKEALTILPKRWKNIGGKNVPY